MTNSIRQPTADERAAIRRSLDGLKEFVRSFARSGRAPFDPRVLDEAYAAWRVRKNAPADVSAMLEALGFAFGQHLIDTHKFRWIVDSEDGREDGGDDSSDGEGGNESFAVEGGKDDSVVVFPLKLVAAGHAAGKQHFLEPLAEKIRREVEASGRG